MISVPVTTDLYSEFMQEYKLLLRLCWQQISQYTVAEWTHIVSESETSKNEGMRSFREFKIGSRSSENGLLKNPKSRFFFYLKKKL